jgi:hypothetical protein
MLWRRLLNPHCLSTCAGMQAAAGSISPMAPHLPARHAVNGYISRSRMLRCGIIDANRNGKTGRAPATALPAWLKASIGAGFRLALTEM